MPPRRPLAIVPPPQTDRAPDLRDAVRDAIAQMPWLTAADGALKALALRVADEIEGTIDRAIEADATYHDARGEVGGTEVFKRLNALQAWCDVAEVVSKLGPQLQAALRDLGGTPATRAKLSVDKPVGGRLAGLQQAAKQTARR